MKQPGLLRRLWARASNWLTSAGTAARRSVYKGAEMSRLWYDWVASPISPDQELYNDVLRLRGRARELRRNHPLIRQYVAMLSTNIIGPDGMQLRARIRNAGGNLNKQLNARIEAAWSDWAREVTVDGTMGLVELQQLLVECLGADGEFCIRKIRSFPDNPYKYALQPIDPDLLDHQFFRAAGSGQNEVRLGVEVNGWGRPVAYWFWDRYPTDLFNSGDRRRVRIPADEILHIYRPDRVNQSRGVTWLNSIMFPAKMVDGYVEAEVVAARIGAAKMGFFEVKDAADYEQPKEGQRLTVEAQPGQFEALPPGYEFKPWSPEHPSTAFPSFMKTIVRWIASGLRVSYNTLANDLEGVNYSSLRSALLTERDEWRKLQMFWARRVLLPIYAEWLEFAQLSGKLYLDSRDWSAFLAVRFMPRGWAWVDPLKDVNASIAAVENGLTSRGRVLDEQGLDFEEIAEELSEEQKLIAELGLTLTGVGVGGGDTAGDQPGAEGDQQQQNGGNNDRGKRVTRRERLRLVAGLLSQER